MVDDRTTASWSPGESEDPGCTDALALALLACPHEPGRVGELVFLPRAGEEILIGRKGDGAWVRHRPRETERTGPLTDPTLSRHQLLLRGGRSPSIESLGRLPLTLNNRPVATSPLVEGDLLTVGDRYLFMVTRRPRRLPGARASHDFGGPDAHGQVGESAASWALRDRVDFVARRHAHVLITGPSGSGKELVAGALHRGSERARRPMVSRSAATIPESLADAELFGNLGGYPNPGMAERPGLIGEADRSTLFLDEFGELPIELQARLLRVLDDGEYTRLGEARPRRADLRLVAATNRDAGCLKHDVLARFGIRIEVPPLQARREDIPLIATHLLRGIARDDAELARRFFIGGTVRGVPRTTLGLVQQLVTHPYTTHVRELEALLWASISAAREDTLDVVEDAPVTAATQPVVPAGAVDPSALDPALIQATLDRHGGRQEPTWKELGLSSRYVLARLVRKHDLRVRGRG